MIIRIFSTVVPGSEPITFLSKQWEPQDKLWQGTTEIPSSTKDTPKKVINQNPNIYYFYYQKYF